MWQHLPEAGSAALFIGCRFAGFLGILTLESFTAAALGLSVGAAVPNTDAAVSIGPAVMLVWINFGGFYCNSENIPSILRWLPRCSLIKHAFEALCIKEFQGMEFQLDEAGRGMKTGEDVLSWLSFSHTSIPRKLGSEARILGFYYWLTYCILRAGKPKFQPVEAAPAAAPPAAAADKAAPLQEVQKQTAAAASAEHMAPGSS